MCPQKPWSPKIDGQPLFNPFAPPDGDRSTPPKLREPQEDTAPLQGTKDVSDADSLQDVIADSSCEQPSGDA
jgi:hypothetical protein